MVVDLNDMDAAAPEAAEAPEVEQPKKRRRRAGPRGADVVSAPAATEQETTVVVAKKPAAEAPAFRPTVDPTTCLWYMRLPRFIFEKLMLMLSQAGEAPLQFTTGGIISFYTTNAVAGCTMGVIMCDVDFVKSGGFYYCAPDPSDPNPAKIVNQIGIQPLILAHLAKVSSTSTPVELFMLDPNQHDNTDTATIRLHVDKWGHALRTQHLDSWRSNAPTEKLMDEMTFAVEVDVKKFFDHLLSCKTPVNKQRREARVSVTVTPTTVTLATSAPATVGVASSIQMALEQNRESDAMIPQKFRNPVEYDTVKAIKAMRAPEGSEFSVTKKFDLGKLISVFGPMVDLCRTVKIGFINGIPIMIEGKFVSGGKLKCWIPEIVID